MPEFVGSPEVIEMFAVALQTIACTSQVPANGKATILHETPKQSELSEVANCPNVSNLHSAPQRTTEDVRSGRGGRESCLRCSLAHIDCRGSNGIMFAVRHRHTAIEFTLVSSSKSGAGWSRNGSSTACGHEHGKSPLGSYI